MSGALTITAIYDGKERGFSAERVLKLARHSLGLLNAIDKDLSGKKRPTVIWDVNIYSLSDRAVIEFSPRHLHAQLGRKVAEAAQKKGLQ